jgi:hypothetical protein
MPPTFILSQDQTLQFCIDSPTQLESHAGRNRIKPTVDVLLVTGFRDWDTEVPFIVLSQLWDAR